MGNLNGQLAIVTGGGSGIGRSTALLLAKEGARVVVTGRRQSSLQETVDLIEAAGGLAVETAAHAVAGLEFSGAVL